MRPMRVVIGVLVIAALCAPSATAQDVAITNARIVVGNGQVIDSGTIVVRGGKIASVTAGAAATQGLRTIEAKGMTAISGYIDAHKHVNTGPDEKAQMQALLEAGYTTILSGGGPGDGNITLRDHIESGTINGPRIIPSERVNLRGTPDEARAAIRAMAAKGIKHTGEIGLTPIPGPSAEELAVLRATVDEAGANRDAAGKALGTEAAYPIVNARTIWDHGGLIGYCTDTNYEALAGLEHELKSYSIVFSMQDIFKLMGPNTAAYIGMADQLGTLEAGKLADILLLDGNPLEGIHNMLKTKLVLKSGKVVVDKR